MRSHAMLLVLSTAAVVGVCAVVGGAGDLSAKGDQEDAAERDGYDADVNVFTSAPEHWYSALSGVFISDDAIDHDASCFTCESRDTSTAAWMTDDGWLLFLKLSLFFLKDEAGDAISDDSIDQHPGCCMNWPWELKSTGSKSGN